MATEEDDPRTHSLPPYSQLILAAISSSGDDNGATESTISDFIGSSHSGELPPSHPSLLATHLNRMTEAGDLLLIGGCYVRSRPDAAPVKRGRGRPPKPKLPGPASSGPSASKRRGRPPKPADPLAPAKIPRPRGRPPKNGVAAGSRQDGLVKRPSGRPPKIGQQFTEVGFV